MLRTPSKCINKAYTNSTHAQGLKYQEKVKILTIQKSFTKLRDLPKYQEIVAPSSSDHPLVYQVFVKYFKMCFGIFGSIILAEFRSLKTQGQLHI